MAQIPQINNPITAKNYNYSPRPQDENTEPFDIIKLTGVGTSGGSGDAAARSRLEMGNRELIPMQVQVAKDPTMAVETLKDLLNVEVLNQALITGHTELYGKLEDLAKELYVTPEELVQEIQNQEQQNTMFSGHEFYDVLREVAQTTTDPTTKELIGNLLKSLNFAQNKSEILGALRANLKFLSDYYSPNEKLSAKLLDLSREWGAQDAEKYFDYLKGETLNILKDVSGSLLNDDKTQMLIPLIVHNLSRYNNNPYMCKEYFNLLLTQITSGTLRESLKNSFGRLFSAIFNKQPMHDPATASNDTSNIRTSNTGAPNTRAPRTNAPNSQAPGTLNTQPANSGTSNANISDENASNVQTQYTNASNDHVSDTGSSNPHTPRTNEMNGQITNVNTSDVRSSNGDAPEVVENQAHTDRETSAAGYSEPKGDFILDEEGKPLLDVNGNPIRRLTSAPAEEDQQILSADANTNTVNKTEFASRSETMTETNAPAANAMGNADMHMPAEIGIKVSGLPVFGANGSPLTDDEGVLLTSNGEPIIDENGEPVYEGDIMIFDENGEPVLDEKGNPVYDKNLLYVGNPETENNEDKIPLDNYTTNPSQNQPLSANTNNKNSNLDGTKSNIQHNNKTFEENFVDNDEAQQTEVLTGYRKFLFDSMSEKNYTQQLKSSGYNIELIMNNYNRGKITGMDAVKALTKGLFINDKNGVHSGMFMRDLSKINTMQELIDNLNALLRAMPDIPLRERMYGSFVDVIDKMSKKNELPQHGVRPPVSSTLDSLTDFIQENINHPALKSLDSFNAANLLQSLLNAPGVFTPLAHYILPLDVDGTKAFGELWVDNDENNPNNTPGTQRNYHLFLTFDVESIGRFELDMYALGENVNLALLYPPRFERKIDGIKERVNKIVRNCGYSTRTFDTAPLKKPHNLTEIFPKIMDKRTTLNKRV